MAREVGDKRLEGASLNNLSLVYDELGDYDTSLAQYQQVLGIYRDADFPRGVGDTLGNIGGVYLLLGRYREALGYYQQALAISERLESKPSMSQDHGNIALCLLGLGEIDTALGHFDQAIGLAQQAGMRQDEAYWLLGKGNGLIQKGRYDLGLEHHRTALAIYEEVGAQAELLEALHDMGRLHLLLGDADSAERDSSRVRWSWPARSGCRAASRSISSRWATCSSVARNSRPPQRPTSRRGAARPSPKSKGCSPRACCGSRWCIENKSNCREAERKGQSGARDRARDRGTSGRSRVPVRPGGTAASPRADGGRTRGFQRG